MSLRDLSLMACYETSDSNSQLLDNFYIPALENSNKYFRIAGFFSSSALVIASKGIEGLISNNGKMYLLISPELSEDDYQTILEHNQITSDLGMFSDLDLDSLPHENLQALAWMLDSGRLEIKIAIGKKSRTSLFHQKVGILFDDSNNYISFSGSINESAKAWLDNIEEFKVFCSWEPGQVPYLEKDLEKFSAYWKNQRPSIAEVFDLPTAIKNAIIQKKPKDIWDLNIMRRYRKDRKLEDKHLPLFPHQANAVQAWINNNYSLLMEMATGTGKTRTAIGCILHKLTSTKPLLVIVSTPQGTLSRQWENEINLLDIRIDRKMIADGGNRKKWAELETMLFDLCQGLIDSGIVYTTHATASDNNFINIISNNKRNLKILFIADEVHAAGSAKQKQALLSIYDYRIGLSATPERMFDDVGTNIIRQYFGNNSFEFSIYDALNTINPVTNKPFLNRFEYHPIFVPLTKSEEANYAKYTQKIAILKSKEDYDPDELQRLYDRRADIGKNADGKMNAFDLLLNELNPAEIQDTIVFLSDQQIKTAFEKMGSKDIKCAKITEDESATKVVSKNGNTERQQIISQFKAHLLQILVGIKCLDEGIDIPNARIALLLSNSTNPREYVQRVGRVIRQAEGKDLSIIYDFIVTPSSGFSSGSDILEKEARRAFQIACNATNFENVQNAFMERGVIFDAN